MNVSWNFGDGATSTQESPAHDYKSEDTTYIVSLVAENIFGCADTVHKEIDIPKITGMKEVPQKNELKFYPNPAQKRLTLSLPQSNVIVENIRIIGITGVVIIPAVEIDNGEISLDISHLSEGIYFVELVTQEKTSFRSRFIKY